MFVELLLGDKTQCVYTDVVKIPEDEGVPQGSALDPVLFSFFMNNIRKNMQLQTLLGWLTSGSGCRASCQQLHYCAV